MVINPEIAEDRRVEMLATADGKVIGTVSPAMAERLGLTPKADINEATFRKTLEDNGVVMHRADCLFYFAADAKAALLEEISAQSVRRLDQNDAARFTEFEAAATEQDLDDAYVELDHWAVFGSFEEGRIVAAASAYHWGGAGLADIGVLTLPAYRGNARDVVRALVRHAYGEGYEPQYRCQVDNHASGALAKAAGLTQFGTWEVVLNT